LLGSRWDHAVGGASLSVTILAATRHVVMVLVMAIPGVAARHAGDDDDPAKGFTAIETTMDTLIGSASDIYFQCSDRDR
jgi:hypothetical protein